MSSPLHLFEGFGVELEYMLVRSDTLDVSPVADRVLMRAAGTDTPVSDVERGPIAWSNELVLHVLELKTNGPAARLVDLPAAFLADLRVAAKQAEAVGAVLLPTAMHPWMDPSRETTLWPHEYSAVYETFDTIFGCSGHGWSNLQSAHLNLPFCGDAEFAALHSAIRLVLPLIPALAASSPFQEGRITGFLDTRIEHYRRNSQRIPSVAGAVVPEPVTSEAEYRTTILEPIWSDLAPHDPHGVLRDEFANARGAIARFSRGAIEIRVVDVQETPLADLAILAAIVALVQELAQQTVRPLAHQLAVPTADLAGALLRAARDGEQAELGRVPGWRACLGLPEHTTTMGEAWAVVLERLFTSGRIESSWADPLQLILSQGPLARRMVAAVGPDPDKATLQRLMRRLAEGLLAGELFKP